jgi:hypothetical protein
VAAPPGGIREERIFPAMPMSKWTLTVVLLCGLGVCVAGYGGLARRLTSYSPASPRGAAPAVIEAEEDEWEDIFFLADWLDEEA